VVVLGTVGNVVAIVVDVHDDILQQRAVVKLLQDVQEQGSRVYLGCRAVRPWSGVPGFRRGGVMPTTRVHGPGKLHEADVFEEIVVHVVKELPRGGVTEARTGTLDFIHHGLALGLTVASQAAVVQHMVNGLFHDRVA